STNALHYAFRTCVNQRMRLLALLQAVAWAAGRTGSDLAELRDLKIAKLPVAPVAAKAEDVVAEVFTLLPSRTYRWDADAKQAVLGYGERAKADEACRKVFGLAKEHPDIVQLFVQPAQSWLCRKANDDAHEYKFLAAIFEDAALVSPAWQPHLLAASVHYFHGTHTPDNPVIQHVQEALRHKG